MSTNIPRPEYPRPQMVRSAWMNLNGEWQFEVDTGKSGRGRWLYQAEAFKERITVPFCPESKLSGIENKDFMPSVWYRREIIIPEDWMGNRILLHFGAVDYDTEVWINGVSVGKHRGGYSSFCFDITRYLKADKNVITVCAEDDVRSKLQPAGKQSSKYESYGCSYTRTTGIWQTVWLECVPGTYISNLKYVPDPDNCCVHIEALIAGNISKCELEVNAFYKSAQVGQASSMFMGKNARFTVPLSEIHLWGPSQPELYDLKINLLTEGKQIDSVDSYFGLRTVTLSNGAILINGKPVFQRLVLDQGFYPEGIYTAPTDEDLINDIKISMGLGFNGARLHEKVFEQRYLYWADKLGYLVWGEHANWELSISTPMGLERFLPEWFEIIERDYNSPAIIGWCPFNETWDDRGTQQDDEVLRITYIATKMYDKTRPVIDTSGNYHVITDIFDIHKYDQDPAVFASRFEPMRNGGETYVTFPERQQYEGQPYFVSEYGGIWWNPEQADETGWGYGGAEGRPKSVEDFIKRYEGLTNVLLDNPKICAFCYTQLYDVEQEVNGLYTYDRRAKFDPEVIRKINSRKAAIE